MRIGVRRSWVISVALNLALVKVSCLAIRPPASLPEEFFEEQDFLVEPARPRQEVFIEVIPRWDPSIAGMKNEAEDFRDGLMCYEDWEALRWHDECMDRVSRCAWGQWEPSQGWSPEPGLSNLGSYGEHRESLKANRSGMPRLRR